MVIILESRLADSTPCRGGSDRDRRRDGYRVAVDAVTLGTSDCCHFVSTLFTAKGQPVNAETRSMSVIRILQQLSDRGMGYNARRPENGLERRSVL